MTSISASKPAQALQNRQHLAWGVLLVAFSVFCTAAALVVIGVHYFIFQSTMPMQGLIEVSRGTAVMIGADLNELGVRDERDLGTSAVVTTDAQSQAMIMFRDQYSDVLPNVADITLKNGASLNVRQFVRPRFDWSTEPYWIHLVNIEGEFDINVPPRIGRDIVITAESEPGVSARLNGAGRYTISVSSAQMQLVNYTGSALLITHDLKTYPIPNGQRGTVQFANSEEFVYAPALANLLGSSGFSPENVIDFGKTPGQAQGMEWRCNSVQNSGPVGHYELVIEDDRPAIRFFRGDGADSHGESNCVQAFNAAQGLDISRFNNLSVRVVFKIHSHTLSACGVEGSECPLMLRLDYLPTEGTEVKSWIHGFYSAFNPDLEYRMRCDTCMERHENVNADHWYTYESGNLFSALPPDAQPSSILNMRFYASGHQYDVYVSSVELLVDQAVIPLPTIEGQG